MVWFGRDLKLGTPSTKFAKKFIADPFQLEITYDYMKICFVSMFFHLN